MKKIHVVVVIVALLPMLVIASEHNTSTAITNNWLSNAMEQIRQKEYEPSIQSLDYASKPFAEPRLHFANRAHNLRAYFDENGMELMPRVINDRDDWHVHYTLNSAQEPTILGYKIIYQNEKVHVEYSNSEDGILQKAIILQPSFKAGDLSFRCSFQSQDGSLSQKDDDCVVFSGGNREITYEIVNAQDANGKALNGSLAAHDNRLVNISINDKDVAYPVSIDLLFSSNSSNLALHPISHSPDLSETPDWVGQVDHDSAHFGHSVATAGDVNGDGYSDVIVGAPLFDFGQTYEGLVFVYHGSEDGLPFLHDWWTESDISGAQYGYSVASAGDFNGDGYSDVVIGAPYAANTPADEGMVFIFYGDANGLSETPDWEVESNQLFGSLGYSVSTAGDVNDDGYSDIIIGAPLFYEGRAFVYHGGGPGVDTIWDWMGQTSSYSAFGRSVSTAGDVNGDGYADVIVGAPEHSMGQMWEGAAMVFLGSSSGLSSSAAWTTEGDLDYALYGSSVSTAGDLNGDGYADIIVGSPWYSSGQYEEGRAFAYTGSSSGLSATADWTAESDQASAHFGSSVSNAGDVNGDGYADVIIGAPHYDNGQTDEGRAYVFLGGVDVLWIGPQWTAESDQASAYFGSSVGTAGDVNGDGFSDVIVGAPWYSDYQPEEGAAFVYHGNETGLPLASDWDASSNQQNALLGSAVSSAGDVNGDGYSEVIIGAPYFDNGQEDEGMAYVFHGSDSGLSVTPDWTAEGDLVDAGFGSAVSTAGDVNGDGYSDVIVGAEFYSNPELSEGMAFVFRGSSNGLLTTPSWFAESNCVTGLFGHSATTAGDVNGDGYSDVIIGAPGYRVGGGLDYGRASVYYGSSTGLSLNPDWFKEGAQALDEFGYSVSSAGDVNRDGYSDVVIGAPGYLDDHGRAFVYLGDYDGLASSPCWVGESDTTYEAFGWSVSTAGDVNGDGFSDVIVSAPYYDTIEVSAGRVFLYHGYGLGISTSPMWSANLEVPNIAATFGYSVSTAGDVNGDGFSDVIIGAPGYTDNQLYEGAIFVFLGTDTLPQGLSLQPNWMDEAGISYFNLGHSVSTAGDINGDGYSDIIAGVPGSSYGAPSEGAAWVYYGNSGGTARNFRQATISKSHLVQLQNATGSSSVRLQALARTPAGRGKVKLQWEIKELDQPFNGTNLGISNDWYDVQPGGTEISEDVTGLQNSTAYHWRARFKYSPDAGNGQVCSRWFSVGPNGMNEKDFITTSLIGVEEYHTEQPLTYTLSVSPNPFSQSVDIRYGITDNRQRCELKVYDITGRLVTDLTKQTSVIGHQSSVMWFGTDQMNRKLASGVYFVKLTVDDNSTTEKILLIR